MKTILTIAGSDCSGGAGIQADIKTITAHKMYAMSAITALTAQNTLGVDGVQECTAHFLAMQLDSIFKDIRPDAVKIGMVSSPDLIEVIADRLVVYKANHIVIDPVMISTSGSKLLSDDAISILIEKLLPLADIITPNIPEAETLCGFKILGNEDMIKAAEKISTIRSKETYSNFGILIKGGHLEHTSDDLLLLQSSNKGLIYWFRSERIDNPNTHGTGCTLSSAIACNLAAGYAIKESVGHAKGYVSGALKNGLNLGIGNGPLNHMYNLQMYDIKQIAKNMEREIK